MAYSVEYRETLRFEWGSPRHAQPATEAIVQKMQIKAASAPTLRADEDFRAQREAEAIAVKALAATRDAITGAKTQVPALYGEDSDEVAALGLKKRSEKKTGGRDGKKGASEE